MKQLLVLSGKGGTGKTTVSSALIALSSARAFADCDVDAPNLHLVVSQAEKPEKTDYYGFGKAVIDTDKCIKCGLCEKSCRFEAIHDLKVNEFECEGCGVCAEICPADAIEMQKHSSGDLILYKSEVRAFSTAKLKMGSGASGKLVTAVKKQLSDNAGEADLAIIDGSPGIGCPVIASISGVSMVLIVAEPTVSGIHDMKRIIKTAKGFGVKCAVCINKFDVNIENSKKIEEHCSLIGVRVIGKIPFDSMVSRAVNSCRSIIAFSESPAALAITGLWNTIKSDYFKEEKL